jgi:serine/threonine-protein kinase HipA
MSSLTVHIRDQRVGMLTEGERPSEYSFAYDRDAAGRAPGQILSVSLPRREEPYGPAAARPFFEGLLPEGGIRDQIARDLKLSSDNSFGLLAELGRDCAGAVVLLREGATPPTGGPVEWLSDTDLEELIERLPTNPLGISSDSKIRLSLAGLQRKAVLVRRSDGAFGIPDAGTPSTHILKPQYSEGGYEDLVFNEHFCMRTVAAAGLDVAETQLTRIGERPCLLVERFDRDTASGRTVRRHQEDLCQALGVPPGLKYQAEGGPGLRDAAALLLDVSSRGGADVLALVRATIANYVLGNSDAHAKNFGLLFRGGARLAPLYDIVCTGVYSNVDSSLAMSIGENADPETIDAGDLLDLAEDCGLNYGELHREWSRVAQSTLRSAETVAALAKAEGWHRPIVDGIVDLARQRAARIA